MLAAIDVVSFAIGRRGWSRFVSTFLLFYAQIIGTEFLLGLVSFLEGYSLFTLNVLLTAGIFIWLERNFGTKIFRKYVKSLKGSVASFRNSFGGDAFWLVIFLIGLAFFAWIIFLGAIFPVVDWDGNTYHLTYVAELIQNHKIYDAPTSVTWLAGYPKGGELIQAWTMLTTHSDIFADLTQVPFLFLGIYALYEIAVTLGADKRQARFSAILFFFLPVVMNQLKTTYVDVITCALFFTGLAVVIKRKLSRLDLFLVGVVLSLLISVKSAGPLFVIALLPWLIWNLYKIHGKKLGNYLQSLTLVLIPLSFGLYWYIKDWVVHGSPIYPFGFKIAGLTIFPGKTFQEFAANAVQSTALPHSPLHRVWFVWTEQKDWFGCFYNYDSNYTGLGPIWFIILIPAFIASIYLAIKKRNKMFLAVAATILALFVIYPSNYYSRYTMFITAGGILGLSLILSNVSRLTGYIIKLLAIALAIFVILTNFSLCNFPPGMARAQFKSVLAGNQRGPAYLNVPGPAFVYLENRVQPHQVVDYDSSPYFIYPLWRSDYSNRVIYIKAKDSPSWYAQINQNHVKYVFTTIGSKENHWAESKMKQIYKDQMYEIFQAY